MSPLYKRLRDNTTILWVQIGGSRLPANKSLKAYTVSVDHSINKTLKQVDFNILHSGNGSVSGGGSSARSDMTCHKCGQKGHIKKYCRSK